MEAVFLRILSLILSVLMFLFNAVSTVFPGILPQEPVENTAEIYDAELFELDETAVVSDYVSWIEVGGDTEKYDWKYFFTGNVALVKVELPNAGYSIEIDSVKENGDVLEIEYKIVSGEGEFADVECSKIILVETSKNISLIKATEKTDTPETPENPENPENPEQEIISYGLYSAENFSDDFIFNRVCEVIEDYESWNKYYVGSDEELEKYDEKFFEEKNLAVLYIEVPDEGKTIDIMSVEQAENGKSISVEFRVKNGESEYTKGFWAVVAETGKDVFYVFSDEIGIKGESVLIDAEMFNPDYMPVREDGRYKIVRTYSDFKAVQNDAFMMDYTFTNGFFDDSSLALIYVMLPDYNYDVDVNSQTENGDTLEIEYSTSVGEYIDEDCESVKYMVIAAEISKNITKVNATEKNFKNNYRSFYTYGFSEMTDEVQIVSDYETWSANNKKDSANLGKYDEEYFKEKSLVLVPEAMPDTGAYFDVVKIKENGETLELVYGVNSRGGFTVIEHKTLVVEVSKNIKKVSAERKDLDNYYNIYSSRVFSTDYETEGKAIMISDYSAWCECAAGNLNVLSRYDAEFFKNNSLVLVSVVLPSSAYETIVRYACEENGALEVGITPHGYRGTLGLTILVYETVVIEVSKDVTQVNAEITE